MMSPPEIGTDASGEGAYEVCIGAFTGMQPTLSRPVVTRIPRIPVPDDSHLRMEATSNLSASVWD